jgi:DNA-binding transcriptional ArsR family regulator
MVDDRGNLPVQIFADTEAALALMRRTAEMAECTIVSALTIEARGDPADRAVPGSAILIELEGEAAGEAVVSLLDWLQREAERGARRGVVSASAALIDLAAASIGHAEIAHLCAADETERVAAVARVVRPVDERLHDSGPESGSRVLQRRPDYRADPAGPADAAFLRATIRARRLRGDYLPADLFADPAWDMLLDLMAARLEGKRVAISSLCIAAAVPMTTALRWIGVLAEGGLVVRVADPGDGRRAYVELAEATARALQSWLREARKMGATAV